MVFADADGAPLSRDGRVRSSLRRVAAAAGVPGGFHLLRQTHGSLLADAGQGGHEIAARLGHRDAGFTARTYVHAAFSTEAEQEDAREDALYGEGRRGDELPPELADRQRRLARLKEAKRRLDEEDAARQKAHQERLAERERIERERGRRLRGRKPTPHAPETDATANTTDPDSRTLKSPTASSRATTPRPR